MKQLYTFTCCLLFCTLSLAQKNNKTISGQLKDIQNDPVAGAIIKLRKANDSTAVQTIIATDNGKFLFANLVNDTFILHISSVGSKIYTSYKLVIDDQHPLLVLPVIVLLPDKAATLKEVIVTSKKPLIEQDIDKTIINVEAMISSATSNALEVLEKTPGITIGSDGDISLNGRSGVLVLIEGRPTYMSATDLMSYLRSIPGSTLDKIELMSNPPAKYDAAGTAVINILFKRNRLQGLTGSISFSFAQGITHSSYNSCNINYLKQKINFFGNLSVNTDRNFDDDTYDRIFFDSNYKKTSSATLQNYYAYNLHDLTARIGMDYALSSKTTIGFITSVYGRNRREQANYRNNTFNHADNFAASGYGNTDGDSKWRQASANVNLQHKLNASGREFSADINYMQYSNNANRLLDNFSNEAGTDSNYIFRYNLPYDINIYTFKADYNHPLKNGIALSGGIKSGIVKNSNASDYTDIINDISKPDLSKSNHFLYHENINAAYLNAKRDGKRFGIQLGLRMENTNVKGHQLGNAVVVESIHSNHYTGLFPSFFLSYKLDSTGTNTLSLNFSRRITRPGYQQLNPFIVFSDQYSYSTGNPYLGSSYYTTAELNYRYKQYIGVSLQYNRNSNAFFNATQQVNNVFITKPQNTDARYMTALMINLNFPVARWCKLNLNMGGANFITRGNIYGQSLDQSIYACRFNLIGQFTLPKNWNAEISGRYTSSIIQLQRMYAPRYQLNAGIQKKILKGRSSVKLNADDIFYTLKQKDQTNALQFATAYHINIQDTRRIGIAFIFNFGKETFARKRRYEDNTTDDVKQRIN